MNTNVLDFGSVGRSSPTANSTTHVAYIDYTTGGKRIGRVRGVFSATADTQLALDCPLSGRTGMIGGGIEVREAALGTSSATDIVYSI